MTEPSIEQVDAAVLAVLGAWGMGAKPTRFEGPTFAGRLLSLQAVEALPAGTTLVRISAGTVVTPLARDQLKRLGIALRLISDVEANRHCKQGTWGFVIDHDFGLADTFRRNLLSGQESWDEIGLDVFDATRWVAGGDDRGVAVVTEEASVAAWRAQQVPGLRAASVGEASAVDRAIRHLGVNLIVVEPAGKSIYTLRHLLSIFRRAGAPSMPEGLLRNLDSRVEGHADRRSHRSRHIIEKPFQPAERAFRDRLAHAALGPGGGFHRSW